jgi:hypothetical protein
MFAKVWRDLPIYVRKYQLDEKRYRRSRKNQSIVAGSGVDPDRNPDRFTLENMY